MIRRIERRASWIANRRGLALAVVGAVALAASMIPYLAYRGPSSEFAYWSFVTGYDEFSYLLAADTFASGRLTNPTHELWRHFETRSVIHQPTYQSMYPPGQAMFLALGRALTGYPIVGVWISMGLASIAICYLLQAWFPPRWALVGALLAALHARMALEWGGTYYGGGVAMLGGALVFGGLRRIVEQPRIRDSLLLALGLGVLANSRPFEGLVASVPAALVLTGWLVMGKSPLRTRVLRVAVPVFTVLAATATSMGYYNYRVTTSPWTLPYQTYLAANEAEQPFVEWQDNCGPGMGSATTYEVGSSRQLEADHRLGEGSVLPDDEWWIRDYARFLWHPSPLVSSAFKILVQWAFYVGPILSVPLLALPWGGVNRWTWFALSTTGLTLVAVLTTAGGFPHYFAPVAPLVFVLAIQGSRSLGRFRRHGRRIGRKWCRTMMLLWLLQFVLISSLFPRLTKVVRWGEPRARLLAQLEGTEGEHLVIVRYGPEHVFYKEWVYNRADIDNAKVVWARELSPERNRRLLDYFDGRRVWLVEPDRDPSRLVPYDSRGR